MWEALVFLIILNLFLALIARYYYRKYRSAESERVSAVSSRLSQSSIYGKTIEQLIPFMKGFPYPAKNFRFIGNPIDGLVFLDDRVVFVEFKFNKSTLSPVQRRIRDLVQQGRVEWKTISTGV